MILKKLKDISYILYLLPLFFISEKVTAQCDVFIEDGSVQVIETSDAVMFTFDVINNSTTEWDGDVVKMYWSLNSGVNIMNIEYGDGSDSGHPAPLLPGESATFYTPWMAIPNLPEWFPEDPGPGGDLDEYWVDALDWPFWSANPNGFDGTWSPMNLRLGSCGLGDGAWVYDEDGEPYYGPQNESVCQDINNDGFCDCDINVTGYDQDSHVVSLEVNSSYNCGCNNLTDNNYMDCYNAIQTLENTTIHHLVFGLNVQTLDEDWLGCLDNSFHEGWVYGSLNFNLNPLESGDMVSEEIMIFNDCWDTMQDLAPNSLCLQMVVWQINFSQTAHAVNSYGGNNGWAATCGTCQYDTQSYPDIDIENNLVVWCFNDNPPEPDIPGCTDSEANNYNPDANVDDESCEYDIPGCTDPVACNYNSSATVFDDSCVYCGPDCVWENPNICEGCIDPEATNYNEDALYDDGSCEYTSPDAVPWVTNLGFDCIDGVPYNILRISVYNPDTGSYNADDTLFVYCVEVLELGLDSCLNGNDFLSSWIEPGGGQTIWNNLIVPNDITEITVNVYNTEGEIDENLSNNSIVIQNISQGPEICEILGCIDTNAINYNPQATEDDGSCEYPPITDLEVNSLVINTIECDIFDDGSCNVGIDFNVSYSNPGETEVNSWIFEYSISSGWESQSIEYGVNSPLVPYQNSFIPSEFTNTFQHITSTAEWVEGDTLCVEVIVLNEEESILDNNQSCIVLPAYPVCIPDCTDPEALNYNENADCEDNDLCEYFTPITDLSLDTVLYDTGCDENGPYWSPSFYLTNMGTEPITEWCINADILSTPENDTICFDFTTIEPGETYVQQWPNIYDWGVLSVHVLHINGNSGVLWNQFGDDTSVANNMYVQIVTDEPECEFSDAVPTDLIAESFCDDDGNPYYTISLTVQNIGGAASPNWCVTLDLENITECFGTGEEVLQPDGDFIEVTIGPIYDTWVSGSLNTLTVVNVANEIDNTNNSFSFVMPDINVCNEGCTDIDAVNYDPNAVIDDGSCEYVVTELTYITAECVVDCDLSGPFYYVNTTWTNTGNVEITDFCAEWNVIGGEESTECYNGSLMPGDTINLLFGPYTSDQGLLAWAYLEVLNGVTFDPPIENYETLYCWGDAESSCIYGCIDEEANNYNSDADLDDGSCEYDVFGCTDPEANNYNSSANVDDGSCTYDVLGCTDSTANNFNPLATIDDGSCTYDVYGCTDESANNYNPNANTDDGSCEYDVFGCTDETAVNYNPFANIDDGSCEYEVFGCTDPEALNYNELATVDNGTCVYQEPCDSFTGNVYISNSFTPDNDGINDLWKAFTVQECWSKWELTILNRWGGVIWYSTNPSDEWDGTFKDNGEYVQNGMYVYKLKALTTNINYVNKNGYIMVIR